MKQITPLVGISHIISSYDVLVCGLNGVLTKGNEIFSEALEALIKAHEKGLSIILLTNSSLRISKISEHLLKEGCDLSVFHAIISMGEILHYQLKHKKNGCQKYYNLGDLISENLFEGLTYQRVDSVEKADFIFAGEMSDTKNQIENYTEELGYAHSKNIPLVCVGTDTSSFIKGEICLAAGAIAEQYALMGGQIKTIDKSDKEVICYVKESITQHDAKILYIGDSLTSDMKSTGLLNADMVLISQGIHVHALGEGYIPDVLKARDLALNYGNCPNYVISGLRW